MKLEKYLDITPALRKALKNGEPVVALESTILSHGMPYPENLSFAAEVEKEIRACGAHPATMALIGGKIKVGLSPEELEIMCRGENVGKVSRRDFATYLATGKTGATTVATTMMCADLAGIRVFATGGIGGVHRHGEVTMDVSADLQELARTPVSLVCAGAKQILDIGRTLEYLETMGVPVIGNGTEDFPAFFCKKSGFKVDYAAQSEEEIARIIERWTGIPVSRLMEGEREKLLHLEDILHQRVVGQDEAVRLVSEAILRSRAGIANPNRPIGSFLFLGPTGVGKTELAKALAQALFDDERNMVRIDMTEYMEKFSVSRLIGAPPGYVGYEEGGQLTEAVRRKPYSVVLFDEVEKAHPDVFNILLQVLDDGRITDSQGRTVDFRNCIVIMTSNIGSPHLLDGIGEDGSLKEGARDAVMEELRRHFRPEFLNRVDEVICFNRLDEKNFAGIAHIMLDELQKSLEDKGLHFTWDEDVEDYLVKKSYSETYGARNLRRTIQKELEDVIATRIIDSYDHPVTQLRAVMKDGAIDLLSL